MYNNYYGSYAYPSYARWGALNSQGANSVVGALGGDNNSFAAQGVPGAIGDAVSSFFSGAWSWVVLAVIVLVFLLLAR
ncbi:MAG TPA: hypothetical protein VKR31_10130 [Rhizomicrobium sp.]|nr:hypothetical protein [Rhizomicrobium sp.]